MEILGWENSTWILSLLCTFLKYKYTVIEFELIIHMFIK